MSAKLTSINITHQLDLEILRCSLCKDYLSYSPIFLLPDGKNMCGRCSSVGTDSIAYRNFVLETIVSNVDFPCRNKNYGCTDRFAFGSVADHSDKCAFNQLLCAFHSESACTWFGAIDQFPTHVAHEHPELTTGDAQFTIIIKEDAKQRFVVSQNGDWFLIDYSYDSKSHLLKYAVAYFVSNLKNQICKTRLSNQADLDCTIVLKRGQCCRYSDLSSDKEIVISLQHLLTFLSDPSDLLVSVIVEPLPKQCDVKLQHTNGNNTPEPLIDYEVLDAHKCWACKYYLILPIFQYNRRCFCNNCHYTRCPTARPVVSETSTLLCAQNYPCRWKGCNIITRGDHISEHETACFYRVYTCFVHGCKRSFTYVLARQHFLTHSDCIVLETSVEEKVKFRFHLKSQQQNVVAFIHNEFVSICYWVGESFRFNGNYYNKFEGYTFSWYCNTSSYDNGTVGKIKFQHQHCTATTTFDIGKDTQSIGIKNLHSCFKEDEELTAVIQLN